MNAREGEPGDVVAGEFGSFVKKFGVWTPGNQIYTKNLYIVANLDPDGLRDLGLKRHLYDDIAQTRTNVEKHVTCSDIANFSQ
ncbi:hypothetical protein PF002_g5154 [Phytophthora fragariae]|uniref:Uncharacterized protein n=1 Tax=Phytophthora fragariae TaxID=53985 RepID=A0A6A3E4A6_9STRA|nr:hypothetical protein PF003_g10808 [Phytophthora fragariae]KAE8924648.1 hypothetical protein PF009_g25124 [Phytophthora fragariae]KAE9024826.1 hypothetical protein PF011_g3310 [Phytophthora fragariae]KAE9130782.1 hypothetical protein PF007_g4369 [Phytophthora fragariae]KAE9249711.1 hypothetical protein PF002_g5154 [Phytophthora fragariae]